MSDVPENRRSGGNYKERLSDMNRIQIRDFYNPWNFYALFLSDESTIQDWCLANGLLATTIECVAKVNYLDTENGNIKTRTCGGLMVRKERSSKPGNVVFSCSVNSRHEKAYRTYSFFQNSNLSIPDIMVFIKSYLDNCSLLQCSKFSGVCYKSTAVNWASYIREMFKEFFQGTIRYKVLSGEIEIDESLFGRRIKYNRGNPNPGMKIWIFGLVERASNSLILYPVSDRTADTLIPLIQRHVAPGSTIYSDGWSAYCSLNALGYRHFTVLHKYSFKKVYVKEGTDERVTVHTNQIEGAWKHAKLHFRKMAGTHRSQFEGHLAEIMWRSWNKGQLYVQFFDLLRTVYSLEGPPKYTYTTPLFESWFEENDSSQEEWTIQPAMTDVESDSAPDNDPEHPLELSSDSDIPPNMPAATAYTCSSDRMPGSLTTSEFSALFESSCSVSSDDPDRTLTEDIPKECNITVRRKKKPVSSAAPIVNNPPQSDPQPSTSGVKTTTKPKSKSKIKMRTDKVCHPKGYREEKKSSKKQKKAVNPYVKSGYQWQWSSDDDDFV